MFDLDMNDKYDVSDAVSIDGDGLNPITVVIIEARNRYSAICCIVLLLLLLSILVADRLFLQLRYSICVDSIPFRLIVDCVELTFKMLDYKQYVKGV